MALFQYPKLLNLVENLGNPPFRSSSCQTLIATANAAPADNLISNSEHTNGMVFKFLDIILKIVTILVNMESGSSEAVISLDL